MVELHPFWEGTTNVLALDALRAIAKEDALAPYLEDLRRIVRSSVSHPSLVEAGKRALEAADHAEAWLPEAMKAGQAAVEAGARRFAFTLGRAMQLALLCRQAQWDITHKKDGRTAAAAKRFAQQGVDQLRESTAEFDEAKALAMDEEWPSGE